MNRLSVLALSLVVGTLIGSVVTSRPAKAQGMTLFGTADSRLSVSGPIRLTLRDCKTEQTVAVIDAEAQQKGTGFVAHSNSASVPDGVYAVVVTDSSGATLAADTFVNLQTSTPGIAQVGHINITGTLLADRIGVGINPTIARIQVEDPANIQGLRVRTGGAAITGQSLATSGVAFGGQFFTSSPSGRAVFGQALSATGNTRGGLFQVSSPDGIGVVGQNLSTSGVGILGQVSDSGEAGVKGTGQNGVVGVGVVNGVEGSGINGVSGKTAVVGGRGVFAAANVNGSIGVQISASGADSLGLLSQNGAANTTAVLSSSEGAVVAKKGDITKVYKANQPAVPAVPIAYGVINADGTIASGSGNFTSSFVSTNKQYLLNVDNYDEVNRTTVVVTPYENAAIGYLITFQGRFRIEFKNLSNTLIATKYSFIAYADPTLVAGPPGP